MNGLTVFPIWPGEEARGFIFNKPEADRDNVESLFMLLSKRFGSGGNRSQARAEFTARKQKDGETIQQYLDELEGLRLRAFPVEE